MLVCVFVCMGVCFGGGVGYGYNKNHSSRKQNTSIPECFEFFYLIDIQSDIMNFVRNNWSCAYQTEKTGGFPGNIDL